MIAVRASRPRQGDAAVGTDDKVKQYDEADEDVIIVGERRSADEAREFLDAVNRSADAEAEDVKAAGNAEPRR
jgi:Flp pilus assembly CpaF family ATPase